MKHHRKAEDRGLTKTSWLEGRHSFSFGRYYDSRHLGFGNLVVINDDIVQPNSGFSEHGHDNMEIVTYIIEGKLSHADSLGNKYSISAGEAQRMSAGTGIRHSEMNLSENQQVRLLQIWFLPKNENTKPSYEQKFFDKNSKNNKLKLIVSENGEQESLKIGQDVNIFASVLDKDFILTHDFLNRDVYFQIAKGKLEIDGEILKDGDGLGIKNASNLAIKSLETDSEFLVFSV
jgi:redox-sensitive bicupin YhaK (pirin superfamily)